MFNKKTVRLKVLTVFIGRVMYFPILHSNEHRFNFSYGSFRHKCTAFYAFYFSIGYINLLCKLQNIEMLIRNWKHLSSKHDILSQRCLMLSQHYSITDGLPKMFVHECRIDVHCPFYLGKMYLQNVTCIARILEDLFKKQTRHNSLRSLA